MLWYGVRLSEAGESKEAHHIGQCFLIAIQVGEVLHVHTSLVAMYFFFLFLIFQKKKILVFQLQKKILVFQVFAGP